MMFYWIAAKKSLPFLRSSLFSFVLRVPGFSRVVC
jgi:hypothetical protein